MKASKQRKMQRAIIANKALRNKEAVRLTNMQDVVMSNDYKYFRKEFKKINEEFRRARNLDGRWC